MGSGGSGEVSTREEIFTDIAEAIYRLRRAFKKHHLEAPVAIELGSHEDMMRLRDCVPAEYLNVGPMLLERPSLVANIAGVDIVAPAQFRARKRGGFDVV